MAMAEGNTDGDTVEAIAPGEIRSTWSAPNFPELAAFLEPPHGTVNLSGRYRSYVIVV
jgi:hypothetical protein